MFFEFSFSFYTFNDCDILSNANNETIRQYIKIFSWHYLIQQFDLSYNAYIFIDIIIIILFIIRMTIILFWDFPKFGGTQILYIYFKEIKKL